MRTCGTILLGVVALGGLHCGSADDCAETKTCASSPDASDDTSSGGVDGGTDGTVPVPADCDPNADPKDAPKCVVNDYGIFVDAASGNDNNSGSKELPVKSIGGALKKLNGRPRIYVCEGTYAESVKLTSPISIYGGFACGTWTYSGTKPTVSPTQGIAALEIVGVTTALRVSDLAFVGAPASSAAPSSVAIFVRQSKVDFLRIDARGLDGLDGTGGVTASNYDATLPPSDPKLRGKSGTLKAGGAAQTCLMLCGNNIQSAGGKGGDGGDTPSDGEKGQPDRGAGVAGLKNAECTGVGAGGFGGKGNPGQDGAHGDAPTVVGKIIDSGWAPSDGPAGAYGGPGQGGGGGGGKMDPVEGAGGGGGCGGCGGAPGGVARGGGASIALLLLNSVATVTDSSLSTQKAGNGGNGSAGQTGQVGGAGGAAAAGGCQGGGGGNGGAGGGSAGGAGGISVGAVYRGDKPLFRNVTVTPGAKGTKGTGGASPTNDGPEGLSQEELEVPL